MVTSPERRLSELSLLREGERAQLLAEVRPGAAGHPRACVHELFAEQAGRTPGAVALVCGGEALTYAELEAASNRLAHHLRARGVGPEVRVGLCLERGHALVVGALGILKAGGAYVPLDPAYPPERLAFTLSDAGASLLLTHSALLDVLPAFGGDAVFLDADREAIARRSGEAVPSGVGARNAAYVVYTSGSTGRPKGVLVEHGSLANTLLGARETLGLGAGEVFPAMAELRLRHLGVRGLRPPPGGWGAPAPGAGSRPGRGPPGGGAGRGGRVPRGAGADGEVVRRVRTGPGTLPRVRRVFVGGDAVPPDLLAQMREVVPGGACACCTGPPRRPSSPRPGRCGGERPRLAGDGAGPPGAGLYVWTRTATRCPWACPGSCSSAGRAWRAATWGGRS